MNETRQGGFIQTRVKQFKIVTAFLALVLTSGCAGVRSTIREASGTLNSIAMLSQLGDEALSEEIDTAETQILDACSTLLDVAFSATVDEHLPILIWLSVLWNQNDCHNAVERARQELVQARLLASG